MSSLQHHLRHIIGAVDGDFDVLGGGAAVAVIDGDGEGGGDCFPCGQEVEGVF